MATILSLLKKVQALDTDKVINEAFEKTTGALEDINRERMLDGVRSDGSIMPNYSFISQTVYGYPNEPIKLKATGAFQRSIIVKVQGNSIIQESTDKKNDMLVERYGEEIFGTGGDYKKEYQDEHLRPELNRGITQATGLKFGK